MSPGTHSNGERPKRRSKAILENPKKCQGCDGGCNARTLSSAGREPGRGKSEKGEKSWTQRNGGPPEPRRQVGGTLTHLSFRGPSSPKNTGPPKRRKSKGEDPPKKKRRSARRGGEEKVSERAVRKRPPGTSSVPAAIKRAEGAFNGAKGGKGVETRSKDL